MPDNILKTIRDFFGLESGEFTRMWKELSTEDRAQIKQGITDGSFTY
jgi:hypothetical protein